MTAGELLDEIRGLYLDQFASVAAALMEDGVHLIAEPAYRDAEGKLLGGGALGLHLRLDLVPVKDGQAKEPVRVDSEKRLAFETLPMEWAGGVEVRIDPFFWDDCQVRANGIAIPIHWQPLKQWFIKWFDTEDKNEPDEQGFLNVIHFMSDPVLKDRTLTLSVDFGTAPVEAFEELLDALRNLGAAEIEIGTEESQPAN